MKLRLLWTSQRSLLMPIATVTTALNTISAFITPRLIFAFTLTWAALSWVILLTVTNPRPISAEGAFKYSRGGDFVSFYAAGLISKTNPENLYNTEVQREVEFQLVPSLRPNKNVFYLYPPFFSILLIPLTWLPYVQAYWFWTSVSVCLYFISIRLLVSILPAARARVGQIYIIALSAPALFWSILLGQTTAFGLFIWTLSFYCLKQGRLITSGLILGLLSYRFQFLTLAVPGLFLKRFWRVLIGLTISSLILVLAGSMLLSFRSYLSYLNALVGYLERRDEYFYLYSMSISLYGFFRFLAPNVIAVGLMIPIAIISVSLLIKATAGLVYPQKSVFDLQFALLITLTLVIMPHGMFYDLLVLTIPGLIIFEHSHRFPPYYKLILVLLYFAPFYWFVVGFASKDSLSVTQPLLLWLSYEIYRAHKNANHGLEAASASHGLNL